MDISRRQFLKLGAASGAGLVVPWSVRLGSSASVGALRAFAVPAAAGLSDPANQPKFAIEAPNALDPAFKYTATRGGRFYGVGVGPTMQETGLKQGGRKVSTSLFGYGQGSAYTWPGKTFEVQSGQPITVRWANNLVDGSGNPLPHLLPWTRRCTGLTPCTATSSSLSRATACPSLPTYTAVTLIPLTTAIRSTFSAQEIR
jgi:hypothetical protein